MSADVCALCEYTSVSVQPCSMYVAYTCHSFYICVVCMRVSTYAVLHTCLCTSVHMCQGKQIIVWDVCVRVCLQLPIAFIQLLLGSSCIAWEGRVFGGIVDMPVLKFPEVGPSRAVCFMTIRFPEHIKSGVGPSMGEPVPWGPPAGAEGSISSLLPVPLAGELDFLAVNWDPDTHSRSWLTPSSLAFFPEPLPFRGERVCTQRRD